MNRSKQTREGRVQKIARTTFIIIVCFLLFDCLHCFVTFSMPPFVCTKNSIRVSNDSCFSDVNINILLQFGLFGPLGAFVACLMCLFQCHCGPPMSMFVCCFGLGW
jgi:hypothetical protein